MKKILVMALAVGAIGFTACSDDNDEDDLSCAQIEQNIVNARAAYEENPDSNEACQALRAALQDYLDKQCETEFDPFVIESELEALNCDDA